MTIEQQPEAWMLIDKETGARIPRAYKPEHGVNQDRWELYPLYIAPPKREQTEQEPFFQKTYYADNLEGIMEDFYDKLNAYDCVIPLDENGFNVGVFEVTVNWREE